MQREWWEEARQDVATQWLDDNETWRRDETQQERGGMAMQGDWDARRQGAERQHNNQPNEQTNGRKKKKAGAT